MARITVEDCLEKVDNQYDLVLLAKERTVQLNAGAPMLVEEDNDKRTIISLREIGDGKIDVKEVEVIEKIGRYMYINIHDMASIKAMFFKEPKQYYKILDITSSASDSDVKRAYRKMAMKYHPDKLSELSQAQQKMGKEKFLKVQEAYEAIKKERGI